MGGMGRHFDETVIKAFLRKVAPFPAGSKVQLSNDEVAYVLKNYPDQPLRPLVAVEHSETLYDLSFDENCMNITITKILEENKNNQSLINM